MTAAERLEDLLNGKPVDRPPFMPAIYDLKPAFLQSASHSFGQRDQDIIEALTFEAERLEADSLTSAYDIYNIEAEAVGCSVLRNPKIGMPEISEPLIDTTGEIEKLEGIQVTGGRMGIFISAAENMIQKYGDHIPVRGGISGPFSMATKIIPKEALLMETVVNPDRVISLLEFCTQTIKIYAKAFAEIGAGVVVFDSFVTPPMLSPQAYRDLVLPFHKEIFHCLENKGVQQRTLIVGGNTIPILDDIVSSGATQFLLDFTIPLEEVTTVLQEFPSTAFRVNLPPSPFTARDTVILEGDIDKLLKSLKNYQNLIIGTGILPPNVPASNILAAKNKIVNFYN
jgi:uroporphyrinogen decarboxylase